VQSTSVEHSTQVYLGGGAGMVEPVSGASVKQRGFAGSRQSPSARHATQAPWLSHLGRLGSVHSESTLQRTGSLGAFGGGAADATARSMKPVSLVVQAPAIASNARNAARRENRRP
jgi:hypothetical protein